MNMIERYVERMMAESTPERPLWNIEKIKEGKVNGWNYIDGCMMIALLNMHRITGEGVPCVVIVIPCRYCHSGVCVCKMDDIENAKKLAFAVLEDMQTC